MPKKRTEVKCAFGTISYGYLLKKAVLPEVLVSGYASSKKKGVGRGNCFSQLYGIA